MNEKTLKAAGYHCRAFISHAAGVPVVFLHGFSYTSEVWQQITVTDLLSDKKVPFLALDMPYGQKSECHPKTHDPEANVALAKAAIEETFGSQVPVLVGTSLGGGIALEYAARFPVKGLLLVAPARASEVTLLQSYEQWQFPVRIIWGSEDHIISGEGMRNLAQRLPNAKLVTYHGAGHSAYLAEPEKFKRDLLELYAAAELT